MPNRNSMKMRQTNDGSHKELHGRGRVLRVASDWGAHRVERDCSTVEAQMAGTSASYYP